MRSNTVFVAVALLAVIGESWFCGVPAVRPVFGNQPVCSFLASESAVVPANGQLQEPRCWPVLRCLQRTDCFLHFAGSAVCEPQRLQAHRKLQDASAAASAASGAASGAAAAGASSESTSAAAAAAAAATGEASHSFGTRCSSLRYVLHTASLG